VSNHSHIVLFVDPEEAQAWSDEEVARRWLPVFPGALRDAQSEKQKEYIVLGLRSDPERLKEIRSRLGSLSWFMRALNEPIARRANVHIPAHREHPFWRNVNIDSDST